LRYEQADGRRVAAQTLTGRPPTVHKIELQTNARARPRRHTPDLHASPQTIDLFAILNE